MSVSSNGVVITDTEIDPFVALIMNTLLGSNHGSIGGGSQTPPPVLTSRPWTTPSPPIECTVCLEPLKSGDEVTALTCPHSFHHDCLLQHVRSGGRSCPNCREPLQSPSLPP